MFSFKISLRESTYQHSQDFFCKMVNTAYMWRNQISI